MSFSYENIFESLLRGKSVDVLHATINQRSMISQFSKFKSKQFGADWLRTKTLGFQIVGAVTTISLIPYKRSKVTFTILESSQDPELPDVQVTTTANIQNVPALVGEDQSG